jgi:hypothetical protein
VELRPAQGTQTAVEEKMTPREALRRLQKDARLTPEQAEAYLNPPPLTPAQVENIYGPDGKEEARERRIGRTAFAAVRRASRKGARP